MGLRQAIDSVGYVINEDFYPKQFTIKTILIGRHLVDIPAVFGKLHLDDIIVPTQSLTQF